jgi:hypothetical protein
MNLRDFYGKYVIVLTCNDLIIIGEVFDYYPAIGTESGEDEIDIFPNGTNHIILVKESEILSIEELFL